MADQQLYSADAAVCVSSLERASVYVHGVRTRARVCVCARARLCARGIQCTEQCTGRCIYTREIIAIGGALVSSRYIDLPASSWLLPKNEDFLPPGRRAKRAVRSLARSKRFPEGARTARGASMSCGGGGRGLPQLPETPSWPRDECRAKVRPGPLFDLLAERRNLPRETMTLVVPSCQPR